MYRHMHSLILGRVPCPLSGDVPLTGRLVLTAEYEGEIIYYMYDYLAPFQNRIGKLEVLMA